MNMKSMANAVCQRNGIVVKCLLAILFACPNFAHGQTVNGRIVAFDFSNTTGFLSSRASQSNNAIYVDTSLITKSPSLANAQNSALNGNFIVNNYFVSSGWTAMSEVQAVANNAYYQFTIVPKLGYEYRVDSIVLRWRSALTGATNVFIRSSWNNYGTTIATDTVSRNASGVLRLALTSPVTSDSAITFRIYAYGAAAGQSFGIGEKPISTVNPDIDVRGRMSTSVPLGTIQQGIGATSICQGNSVWIKHTFTGGTPPYTVFMKDGSGQMYETTFQHSIDSVQISPELTWTYTIDSLKDVNGNKSISHTGSASFQVTQNSALSGVGVYNASFIISDGALRTFGDASQCKSWVRIADSVDGITLGTTSSTLQNMATNPFNGTSRFFAPRKVSINAAQVGTAFVTLYYTQQDFNAFNSQVTYQHKMPLDSADLANDKSTIRIARANGSFETASLTFIEPISVNWNTLNQHWEVMLRVSDTVLNGQFYITSLFSSTKLVGTISHTSITPSAGSTNASVTIQWDDVPAVTQYRFRFRPQGTLHWTVSTITGSERTYNYLLFNTTYEVQIRVYESATQQGEYSNIYTFTTPPSPGKLPECSIPTPSATLINANSVQINWSPVLFAQSYQVQLREKNTLTWGGTTTANNQVSFSALLPSTTYEYRVRTHCTAGYTEEGLSNYSTIDTFKTPELVSCLAPSNLSIVSVNATSATISWLDNNVANLYNLQMRVKNTATWGGTSLADSAYTFLGLSPNTTYEFRVRSVCSEAVAATSTSPFSSVAEFTTGSLPLVNCLPPSQINASASANSITVAWDASTNGQLYFVQFKPSTSLLWGGSSTGSTQFTFNNLSPNTSYNYRIRTTCEAGTTFTPMSSFSSIGTITTSALREWSSISIDGVYPNPTNGDITIVRNNTKANLYRVYLTDMAGRMLQQTKVVCNDGAASWTFSVANYPKGVYLLRVVDETGDIKVYNIQRM
jgi:hypothetical protein